MPHNSPITDLAFTSENLYSFLNNNLDFRRRLTNIFTQLLHTDKFNTKVINEPGKSPYRHSSDVRIYITNLAPRLRTAHQRKATTIPSSSVKSAPTYSTAVKKNLDNSFQSALKSNPSSTKMDTLPVSRQKSASTQPPTSSQSLAKTNNCNNYKKRFQTNSKSKIPSKQNASSTFSKKVKASTSINISTSKPPSHPPSLPAALLPSSQPLLQQVNVMGLTRAIPLHKSPFQPPSPFPTVFNLANFLRLGPFPSAQARQPYIDYTISFLAFTPFTHKYEVYYRLCREFGSKPPDSSLLVQIPMATNPKPLTYHQRLAYWTTYARDTSNKPFGPLIRLNTYPYIADLHTSDATLALALNHVFSISPNQLKKLQAITPVTPPTTVSPSIPTPTPKTPFATTTSTTPVKPTPSRSSTTPLKPHQWRSTYVKCVQCAKLYRYTTNKTPRRYHHYPHYHPPRLTDRNCFSCREHQPIVPGS